MTKEVAVFGATGAQGAPVVEEALKAGLKVRAVARNTASVAARHPAAQPVAATFDEPEALVAALSGVDAAFVHLPAPTDPEAPQRWLGNLLAAAGKAALPLLVFTTSGSTGERYPASIMNQGSMAARDAVLSSGIPAIVLQPTIYLENLQIPGFMPELADKGVVDYPPLRPEQRVSWTSHRDQAIVAAAALQRPDLAGQAFEIATPGPLLGAELAEALSGWIDRPASFQPSTPEAFSAQVEEALQMPGMGFVLNDFYGGLVQMEAEAMVIDTAAVEATFGVELKTAKEHIATWAKAPVTA